MGFAFRTYKLRRSCTFMMFVSTSNSEPSEALLERSLRKAVRTVYDDGSAEDLTVKRIRRRTEQSLALAEDFFRNDSVWKERSKTIIQEEVV